MTHKNTKYIGALTMVSIFILLISMVSCLPDRVNETSLDGSPTAPDFTIKEVPGNPNKLVLTDVSSNNFQRLWSLPGGLPKTSQRMSDTVLYAKAGVYKITLQASNSDGSGTGSVTKTVTINQDAALSCSPKLALLTGDCLPEGKCWTMSRVVDAVKVGPTYDDFSWYKSPVNGLQNEQYDDKFCFTFEGLVFQNRNNGATVNPWNQYKAEAYDPGVSDFLFLEGTGLNNRDQIVLQDNQFMGLWDSDNVIDIVKLTKTDLVVRMRLRAQNGVPNAEGWFELTFVAN